MKIKSLNKINRNNEEVYNIEVADNNNYYANNILVSNCHSIKKANEISNILKQIDTPHIFGFTGSLPESKIDEWNVIGKIGPVIFQKSSHELRTENYIADAAIKILKIKYKTPPHLGRESKVFDPGEIYVKENDFLYNNKYRNGIISTICKNLDKNILILVDRIEHGKLIYDIIKESSPLKKVYYIKGDMEIEERENIRALMEIDDNIICIAIAKIFSTGINIRNLHYIFFALAGKAKVNIIQSIGRGLRLHENKQKLVIFDIADDLKYGERHLIKRRELYEKEKINYEIRNFNEKDN